MMTNEQAVEYASKLKRFCREQDRYCKDFPFQLSDSCAIGNSDYMSPCDWALDG